MEGGSSLLELAESLRGAQKNTQRMLSRLQRFEDRLTVIDQKMRPIQNTTDKYSRAKDNISLTLAEVGKTYEYFRIANEVNKVVSEGLNSQNQLQYFDSLARLSLAKTFFEEHREMKSSGAVLQGISSLLIQAVTSCARVMEKILLSCGRSIELVDGQYQIVNPISPSTLKDIKAICDVLESRGYTAHFETYQRVRVAQVCAELKAFESEHIAVHGAVDDDVPYQKGSHPFKELYMFAYEMLRGELQLWMTTLTSNHDSLLVFVAICDAVVMEIQRVLSPIVLEEFGNKSNQMLRQSNAFLIRLDMLDVIVSKYDEFRDICRPDVRHESTASVTLTTARNALVEACIESSTLILESSSDANSAGLHAKGSTSSTSTESCDLHPLTGNVLHCCKELIGFSTVYKRMHDFAVEIGISVPQDISSLSDLVATMIGNLFKALEVKAEKFDTDAKAKSISRELHTNVHHLYDAGEKEAELALQLGKKHLFLANNLFSLFLYLRERKKEAQMALSYADANSAGAKKRNLVSSHTSPSVNMNSGVSPQALKQLLAFSESVEARLVKTQADFCETVASVMGMTEEAMETFKIDHQNDKSGKYRVLKAKFSIFNSGMDALRSQQGEWRVSAAGLREHLGMQLMEKILTIYSEFYNTYSKIKFSKKHSSDYLKFLPQDVDIILRGFFGRN